MSLTTTTTAMTEEQVCEQLNLSRTTLWRMRRKGLLSYCRAGVRIIYTPLHVSDFLERIEHKK